MATEKKARRKKKELDEAIWNALEKQIIENGFNDVTLIKLAQEAGVELPVIYNRFKNKDELIEQYVNRYDCWLNDLIQIEIGNTAKENFKKVLVDLINGLYDNEVMQRVLIWEINDTHKITRRMAQGREVDSTELLEYFEGELNSNSKVVGALMIAGIYYLILHRKISTFCTINFNTIEGKQKLIETIGDMTDRLFPGNSQIMDIAKKLLAKGMDKNTISEVTGIPADKIINNEQ